MMLKTLILLCLLLLEMVFHFMIGEHLCLGKLLLKMGKLKPSPESIDMFMSMGDKTVERVKRTLLRS